MRPSFKKKLDYSIALLQRMEKLALRYDAEHGFWLAFSGGKDSQALYHVAQMAGVRFKAFMSLTSVDPPQVIRFVKRHYPDVERIKPKASIFDLAVEKAILPAMRVRWCCAELKENAKPQTVTLIGIRRAESARRAKRNDVEVTGHKFSGDADGFDAWQEQQMKKKLKNLKNLNIDEFSIQNESMVKCVGGKDSILVSPIINWTEQDVWYFLNEVCHVPHCELYDAPFNMHRIGCILCPMSSRAQKERDMQLWPHVKRGWIDAIMRIRRGEGGGQQRPHSDTTEPQTGRLHPSQPRALDARRTIAEGYVWWNIPASFLPMPRAGGTANKLHSGRVQFLPRGPLWGFSATPSPINADRGQNDDNEEYMIAERIFDWWISGKSYERWFADTYQQQRLPFNDDNDNDNDNE